MSTKRIFSLFSLLTFACAVLLTSACAVDESKVRHKYPEKVMGRYDRTAPTRDERETVFGKGGMSFFGNKRQQQGGTGGIGVNSFLWRATLDTLAFLPLASADAFGGVILSEWYAPPETPQEQFKVEAYIMSRALRADGIRISVFRRVRKATGEWVDASVDPQTALDLENTILTRARELRIATMAP